MFKKSNKSAFNGCPNTVVSNSLESFPTVTFSCPRVPKIIGSGSIIGIGLEDKITQARNVVLATMGNMCVNCAFSGVTYNHTTEASVSPDGVMIESVTWTPVSLSEKPVAKQSFTVKN